MENPIDICNKNINLLLDFIETIISQIGDNPLARADRVNISHFETNFQNFKNRTSIMPADPETAIGSAKNAAIHALGLATGILSKKMYNEETKSTAKMLSEAANRFIAQIDTAEEFTGPYKISINRNEQPSIINSPATSPSDSEKQLIELQAKLRADIENFARDITRGGDEIDQLKQKSSDNVQKTINDVSDLRQSIDKLRTNISNLHQNMADESAKAAKISEDATKHSEETHAKIDDLLGLTASKILLTDYAETAEAEKKSANTMRYFSLACMALTGIVLCIALYESLYSGLDWKQAIFKAFTAIALSIPAAYLARESAKHRNQEHINRRISLDLRAITPYIATLPNEEQNKIKSEIASKIFGAQENANTATDNYPINIQELAKLLIEKIPTQK